MIEKIPANDNDREPTPPQESEVQEERVLRKEDVFRQFEELLGDRSYEEVTKYDDEEGLKAWDVKTIGGRPQDTVLLMYRREKPPMIREILHDGRGLPSGMGGTFVFKDGEWVRVLPPESMYDKD